MKHRGDLSELATGLVQISADLAGVISVGLLKESILEITVCKLDSNEGRTSVGCFHSHITISVEGENSNQSANLSVV